MVRWLVVVWLCLGIGSAWAADADAFTAQMRDLQRTYGHVVVVVRGRDAPHLADTLASSPVAGVSFRAVRPSLARRTVERAGARCGLLATATSPGWRTTLLGPCDVLQAPSVSDAYFGGRLVARGAEVVSAAGPLAASEVALRFGDVAVLRELERRRRNAQRWGGVALGSGFVLGRFVGPGLLVGALLAAPVVAFLDGDMRAVVVAAGVGAGLTIVGVPLVVGGGAMLTRGGQGRGKVRRFFTPAELERGVAEHNQRLAEQLGYDPNASEWRRSGVEWALYLTPTGPQFSATF